MKKWFAFNSRVTFTEPESIPWEQVHKVLRGIILGKILLLNNKTI